MFTFHFDWCQDICSARERVREHYTILHFCLEIPLVSLAIPGTTSGGTMKEIQETMTKRPVVR